MRLGVIVLPEPDYDERGFKRRHIIEIVFGRLKELSSR